MTPEVLSAESPVEISEFQLGGGSVFGYKKPSPFFDLPAARSESPATGFGIRSVSVVDGKGLQKSAFGS